MKFQIRRHDGGKDPFTQEIYNNYDDAYDVIEEIYEDVCCSDADYEDRPYYEIVELKD